MAGELSDRIIRRSSRLSSRQASRLYETNARFFMTDGVSEQTAEAAASYDEYERFARGNPLYAKMENAIAPSIAQTVEQMQGGGDQ
tara:strand:- start:104 stop:361 length:258 start_codon:yes stop_codon:yes gene_type:complete